MTAVLTGLDAERVAALRARQRFFWLDASLSKSGREDVAGALGVPAGALRALPGSAGSTGSPAFFAGDGAVAFTLRCYVLAADTAGEGGDRLWPLDVRVVVTSEYLLTLHVEPVSLPAALLPGVPEELSRTHLVYAVLAAILESAFDALGEVESRLEHLAERWSDGGGGVPRAVPRALGARLAAMRRSVTAQQAALGRLAVEIGGLHGFEGAAPTFDRLQDQADRLRASIDAAADVMGMLLDLQLNERAYLVSVVATIFVPLTFVTGFFGMNFGWMVDHVESPIAFWLLGIGVPVTTAALSWRLLLRRFVTADDA